MKVVDSINLEMNLENFRGRVKGEQVANFKGKAIEVQLRFRIKEGITVEELEQIDNELQQHSHEIQCGFEMLSAFIEKCLPIDDMSNLDSKFQAYMAERASNA